MKGLAVLAFALGQLGEPVAANPWQVGPAPSAHAIERNVNYGVDLGGGWGRGGGFSGARVAVAGAPHPRIWAGLEGSWGSGWRFCIDCRSLALDASLRGNLVQHRAVSLSVWNRASLVNGIIDWTPGAAIEAGTRRLRFDTSWPLWSTYDLVERLRSTPELGLTLKWNARHATRIALVGLEPAGAVTHRWSRPGWQLEFVLRGGEEGVFAEVGVRFVDPAQWGAGASHRRRQARKAGNDG